ncbi:MAG: isochorismatase family protein [Planctomycetes bacterium]|nr:isochorismatase family protein [Planctomycetota bacterium]
MRNERYKRAAAVVVLSISWVSLFAISLAGAKEETKAKTSKAPFVLDVRSRVETSPESGSYRIISERVEWNPSETAVIVCDMWDRHWCKGATARVAELAPAIDRFIAAARGQGALVIHAPSGVTGYYQGHRGRSLAQNAPDTDDLPAEIDKWNSWISEREEAAYPIDQSDGGCDCSPRCKVSQPWRKQIDSIRIKDTDAVSDSGEEIWNLLQQRGIHNVILTGVHANMCIAGRPFGLRNMAKNGKNVVLVRDLTDTMYNSSQRPYVNHFTGTELIVEHIEKFICPTITSAALTGAAPFRFNEDRRTRIAFLIAEKEYRSDESLPAFGRYLETQYNFACDFLLGVSRPGTDEGNHLAGMERLAEADLAIVFIRRRALPPSQMKILRDYLNSGKPLIGIRTASHAFGIKGKVPLGRVDWPGFDGEVLGGNYHGHHGNGPVTTITAVARAKNHPILSGVKFPLTSVGSLYKTRPLADSTTVLLTGSIPHKESEPVAWTNHYKNARIFYTSLGHIDDFKNPHVVRLLTNAVFWALDKSLPKVSQTRVSVTE